MPETNQVFQKNAYKDTVFKKQSASPDHVFRSFFRLPIKKRYGCRVVFFICLMIGFLESKALQRKITKNLILNGRRLKVNPQLDVIKILYCLNFTFSHFSFPPSGLKKTA